MIISSLLFSLGFLFAYLATRNLYSMPIIFGAFYFLATFNTDVDVFMIAAISYFSLGVGLILCNIFHSVKPKTLLFEFRSKDFSNENHHPSWLLYPVILITVFSLGISIYYFANVGISLFSDNVGYDRLINRYSIPGARIMQRFFRVYLPIIVIMYYLFQFSPALKKYYSRFLFLTLFLVAAFLLVATGMRGNVVIFLFIPFIYIKSLVQPIKKKELSLAFVFTFGIGLFATIQMYSSNSFSLLVEIIWSRLTAGGSDGLSYIVGGYTESQGYQFGLTYFNDIMSIFSKLGISSQEYVSLGEEVAMNLLGSRYNGERAGVYFSGELFHNFGIIGVVFGSIFIGYLFQYIYIKTLKSRKDIILVSILGFFTASFNSILGGPVLATIFDYTVNLTFLIFLIFLINILCGLGSRRIYVVGNWLKFKR